MKQACGIWEKYKKNMFKMFKIFMVLMVRIDSAV